MAILTMPVIVLFVLRIVASIADARVAERSKRLTATLERIERESARDRGPKGATSVSSLTEEPKRDQG